MQRFTTPAPGRNTSQKIQLMRHAKTSATARYGIGGKPKRGKKAPRPVTLPTLETARKITSED